LEVAPESEVGESGRRGRISYVNGKIDVTVDKVGTIELGHFHAEGGDATKLKVEQDVLSHTTRKWEAWDETCH
jgi:hypothetical protein